ncbi:MAG: hypothetical protein Q9221_005737 [Calogaya cf. arnoldii]
MIGPQAPPAHNFGETSRLSPYSEKRASIRNLTLPTVVDLNIPSSPAGSPPPGTSQKFDHFLQLKRQGMHFNGKLAGSSALKNPMLLQKLMSSAGLMEGDQYATTLPKDLWDPTAFPAWAYKEELAESHQNVTSRKNDEDARLQRDRVEFVPATDQGRSGLEENPSMILRSKVSASSAAETVAGGLERGGNRLSHETREKVHRDVERRKDRKGR